jgi:hypothetical protein
MVKGMDVWNIDQFAVKNNRPDLLLRKLPDPEQGLINHFYSQYLKRLRKLGLTEDQLSNDYYVPVAKIIETTQKDKFIDIKFSLSDAKYNLKRYNIYINDVPLFGAYGKEISGHAIDLTDRIELSSGENKIEISCMNEKGAESYRELAYATYDKPVQSDLYYIGFGVSKYQNPQLNLQYADKDAADLANVLSVMKGKKYANVFIHTYTNEQVTPENIKKAKDLLKMAKPDDVFILFIAGHGVHDNDKEATYYYLTYNTDLKNLSGTAANFEFIEDLLQGIPPRNKLFLMDACESGEIDDDVQTNVIALANTRGIRSRGFKNVTASNKVVLKSDAPKRSYLFDKDRYIYNDLSRRSGSIVFSSSKGGELSYEYDELKNGLFTSYIMKGLAGEADKNNDGTVTTDELREYVSMEVAKASGDLQHPTVDRDNIYQKFGFGVK